MQRKTSLLEWWRLISEKRCDGCAHSQELSIPTIGIRAGSFKKQFNHWKVDHGVTMDIEMEYHSLMVRMV
jgi:hypothetical protein